MYIKQKSIIFTPCNRTWCIFTKKPNYMQAIILAAGMGKRLGEFTKENTKCMVKMNGECIIDRLLKQLSNLRLERVVIVVGYEGKKR